MKLFTRQGFVTEYGNDTLKMFLDKEINNLLNSARDEGELRMLGCILSKRVGDLVSKRLVNYQFGSKKID